MNDKNNLSNNEFSNTNENTKMEEKILEQLGNEPIVSNSNTNIYPNIPPNIKDQITTNDIDNLVGQPLHTENSHTSTNTQKKKSNKKLLILIPIFIIIILIILFIFNLIKSIFLNTLMNFSDQEKNYVSLDMPLSYEVQSEKDYIKSKVYTFIYDSNKTVKRIIFTDFFYTEEAAKIDYEKYQKSNNNNDYWNMPKKLINLDKKVLTYEYEDDIAEEYYDDFIGENIDNIIEEYGEDRILNNFKPNVSAKDLSLNAKESQTSNSDKLNDSKSKENFNKLIKQAEQLLGENYTKNFNEAYKKKWNFYAEIDPTSVKYTNEYSNSNDFYYVMSGKVKNSETDKVISEYLVRFKTDENYTEMTEYGDTSKINILLDIYEEALLSVNKGIGILYLSKEQYKNDLLWNTEKFEKDTFREILNNVERLDYYYYEYSTAKNEKDFEKMKSTQASNMKKIFNCKEINLHLVQITEKTELEAAVDIAGYINSSLTTGNDENVKKLENYFKENGLYYEELLK